jgi:hypothetical protein
MARKAIERIERPGRPPLSVGHFNLDLITDNDAGWQHAAHDGDTVNNAAAGYFPDFLASIRLKLDSMCRSRAERV